MSGRLRLRVSVVVEPDGDGYHAYCPAFKGLHATGETEDDAVEGARAAALAYLESMVSHGDPIPVGPDCEVAKKGASVPIPASAILKAPGVVVAYSRPIWDQLKGLTLKELAKALKRDGWIEESRAGATIGFIKTAANGAATRRRVVLHVPSRKELWPPPSEGAPR